jgi:hypothetical protein
MAVPPVSGTPRISPFYTFGILKLGNTGLVETANFLVSSFHCISISNVVNHVGTSLIYPIKVLYGVQYEVLKIIMNVLTGAWNKRYFTSVAALHLALLREQVLLETIRR